MSKLTILGAKPTPSQEDQAFLTQEQPISTPEFLQALMEDRREDIAKMIVQDDRLVRSRDVAGASAVQLAVYHGLDEMLGILLRADVALDLAEASAAGQMERVRELIDGEADVNEPGGDGFHPLTLAATYGRVEVAEALVAAGADPSSAAANPTLTTPLHGAAGCKRSEPAEKIVAGLIDAGADVDAEQAGGFTALHRAAGVGHTAVVKRLIDAGADATIESDLGVTAKDLASERGHLLLMALFD
ncbi:MAG: ankyrin repeat domain-containing protein [Acidobacteriota bacterium]